MDHIIYALFVLCVTILTFVKTQDHKDEDISKFKLHFKKVKCQQMTDFILNY